MIRKFIKNMVCMLSVVLCIGCQKNTVWASELSGIDYEKNGSITVSFSETDDSSPMSAATFMLYHVGSIKQSGADIDFAYRKAFEKNGMSLENLQAEGLAEHLANYAADKKVPGRLQVCDKDGKAVWKKLDLGLYLIVQKERADGYYATKPFLVSIPMADSDTGNWIYDVDASPKVEPSPGNPEDTELSVKKVWKDNGKNTPASVKVKLFRDNQEFDSCILNESNNWTKTWDKLSGGYTWTVEESEVPAGYKVTYSTVGKEITLTNTSETEKPKYPSLIQTGQLNWPIPVLAGAGILFFTVGWMMTFMKRKK